MGGSAPRPGLRPGLPPEYLSRDEAGEPRPLLHPRKDIPRRRFAEPEARQGSALLALTFRPPPP